MSDPSPLRVLLVSPPLEQSGGIGRVTGYELTELRGNPSVVVTYVDSRGTGSVAASFLQALRVAGHLVLRRRRYDVVHLNTSSRASTLRKGLVALASRCAGLPYLVHLHGSAYDSFYAAQPTWLQVLIRSYFRHAAGVVVLGDHWQAFVTEQLGVPESRVSTVPNTAPGPKTWTPRETTGDLRVIFLGRLDERKGAHLAVQASAVLAGEGHHLGIVIAGDGNDAELRRLADQGPVPAEFVGWVDEERVHALLADSDVLLLPSAAENQPISVIEAMAHGVVPVVTAVGAVTDLVRDETTGLILHERSVDAVAGCLRRLTDPALLAALSAEARTEWEARLTPARHVRLLVAAWRQATTRAADPPEGAVTA